MDRNIIQNNLADEYRMTEDIIHDAKWIIESAQKQAHHAVNIALVQRNWLLGYRIAEEEMKGGDQAEYGSGIIKKLSKELTEIYG